ncbi:hypothetical protein [Knoellia aerolata]|uniref:Uncharacterized protein n=1 Tax=Knoellia aerolata DSM 18566 TaxID=1385519 RepID=A0A0A0JYQ4_9MICO|nr:hypothetical protein [Knoellia aerolata]KGN41864.1 hypothetical protein N801_04060 [Knoellia aerolata DSM 18566]
MDGFDVLDGGPDDGGLALATPPDDSGAVPEDGTVSDSACAKDPGDVDVALEVEQARHGRSSAGS